MSAIGQTQTDAAQELLPKKNTNFKGRHILLVEYNELNREIAQEMSLIHILDEHLSKPVDIAALEQTVKRFRVIPPKINSGQARFRRESKIGRAHV